MKSQRTLLVISMILLFALALLGCGNTKEVTHKDTNHSVAEKAGSKTVKKEMNKKVMDISLKDAIGTWQGDIGEISIFLEDGGKAGTINFYDYHDDGAMYFFKSYKEKGSSLEFEIDPSMALATEDLSPFSIFVRKVGKSEIQLEIREYKYSLKKVNDGDSMANNYYKHDAFFGEISEAPAEEKVKSLEDELQELSDSEIEIGTLSNHFNGNNHVSTYVNYVGNKDSVEHIRAAILQKIIEMNKIADQYRWINVFTVNSYLSNGVNGETETDKQTNGLTADRVNNQQNIAYQIQTLPNDRWILSKKTVPTDYLAGYVAHFGAQGEFLKDIDGDLNYPLYDAKNMNSYTVIAEASQEGISNPEIQTKIQKNTRVLETTNVKDVIGYWQDTKSKQYYQITYNELGGEFSEKGKSINSGYKFEVSKADGNELTINLGSNQWILFIDGSQLNIKMDDGNNLLLRSVSKDEVEK
jgi:hypothetical protein